MRINITILGQAISFFIFVIFCMRYVWPPLIDAIEKRQQEISNSLLSADRAKKEFLIIKKDSENYLKNSTMKAIKIIEQANERRMKILEQAKIEAKTEYDKIIKQAKEDIKIERIRIIEDLRKQVSNLVLIGVEKIIERSVDKQTNKNILNKIISKL